jgi:uncharacterized protein (TIGR03435 family)
MRTQKYLIPVLMMIGTVLGFDGAAAGQRDGGGRPTFEVASIRENKSGDARTSSQPQPNGTLVIENHSVRQMIRQAYGVWDYQIDGGPNWLDRLRYDITAKASGPATRAQLMAMLQTLLEDRFKLSYRRETRQLPVYALVQATPGRRGPNLTVAKPEDAQGRLAPIRGAGPNQTEGKGATLADLASHLSNVLGRIVVDRTGLTGIYNFTWLSSGDRNRIPPGIPIEALPPRRDDLPSLTTAINEQLGLRLESERGPVEILVIEGAEPPSVN